MGLPGDPGQPMVNGVVEFVGLPKGDKGTQVCWNNVNHLRVRISCEHGSCQKHARINFKEGDLKTV